MTLEEFRKTIEAGTEPVDLAPPLRALWWAARGDWPRAHDTIDDSEEPDGMWVHAHLHRQEGDKSNARYWYKRAGKPEFIGSIEAEWESLAVDLLGRTHGEPEQKRRP